jgi:hypothetical protein
LASPLALAVRLMSEPFRYPGRNELQSRNPPRLERGIMPFSQNLKRLTPRVFSAIIVTWVIACASPIAAFAQPPDPCHSTAISADSPDRSP